MKRTVYLDFTLPVFVEKTLIHRYSHFLKNLIKNIERTSNLKFYFSFNFSNEIHLGDTFTELSKMMKSMVESERAETVLSTSFNISRDSNEQMFIYDLLFSEYFSSYYLGHPRDFEGDPCMMIQNLHTVFFTEGGISESFINATKLLKLERAFVSNKIISESCVYKGLKLIPVNVRSDSLFESFITIDSVSDYLTHNSASYIHYFNVFNIFVKYNQNIETNFSNLLYLLDKTTEGWEFIEIDDENMTFQEKLPSSFIDKLQDTEVTKDLYMDFKEDLIKSISHKSILLDDIDNYRRSPMWKLTGNLEIDQQNMFNLRLLSLVSSEVCRSNFLLKEDFKTHIGDIIDLLIVSDLCTDVLKSNISLFKDKINLIHPH